MNWVSSPCDMCTSMYYGLWLCMYCFYNIAMFHYFGVLSQAQYVFIHKAISELVDFMATKQHSINTGIHGDYPSLLLNRK